MPADDPRLTTALEFYRTAERRNDVLVRNTLQKMRGRRRGNAVLIAGGFHTEGLVKRFREKKISYSVITPQFLAQKESTYFERASDFSPKIEWSQLELPPASLPMLEDYAAQGASGKRLAAQKLEIAMKYLPAALRQELDVRFAFSKNPRRSLQRLLKKLAENPHLRQAGFRVRTQHPNRIEVSLTQTGARFTLRLSGDRLQITRALSLGEALYRTEGELFEDLEYLADYLDIREIEQRASGVDPEELRKKLDQALRKGVFSEAVHKKIMKQVMNGSGKKLKLRQERFSLAVVRSLLDELLREPNTPFTAPRNPKYRDVHFLYPHSIPNALLKRSEFVKLREELSRIADEAAQEGKNIIFVLERDMPAADIKVMLEVLYKIYGLRKQQQAKVLGGHGRQGLLRYELEINSAKRETLDLPANQVDAIFSNVSPRPIEGTEEWDFSDFEMDERARPLMEAVLRLHENLSKKLDDIHLFAKDDTPLRQDLYSWLASTKLKLGARLQWVWEDVADYERLYWAKALHRNYEQAQRDVYAGRVEEARKHLSDMARAFVKAIYVAENRFCEQVRALKDRSPRSVVVAVRSRRNYGGQASLLRRWGYQLNNFTYAGQWKELLDPLMRTCINALDAQLHQPDGQPAEMHFDDTINLREYLAMELIILLAEGQDAEWFRARSSLELSAIIAYLAGEQILPEEFVKKFVAGMAQETDGQTVGKKLFDTLSAQGGFITQETLSRILHENREAIQAPMKRTVLEQEPLQAYFQRIRAAQRKFGSPIPSQPPEAAIPAPVSEPAPAEPAEPITEPLGTQKAAGPEAIEMIPAESPAPPAPALPETPDIATGTAEPPVSQPPVPPEMKTVETFQEVVPTEPIYSSEKSFLEDLQFFAEYLDFGEIKEQAEKLRSNPEGPEGEAGLRALLLHKLEQSVHATVWSEPVRARLKGIISPKQPAKKKGKGEEPSLRLGEQGIKIPRSELMILLREFFREPGENFAVSCATPARFRDVCFVYTLLNNHDLPRDFESVQPVLERLVEGANKENKPVVFIVPSDTSASLWNEMMRGMKHHQPKQPFDRRTTQEHLRLYRQFQDKVENNYLPGSGDPFRALATDEYAALAAHFAEVLAGRRTWSQQKEIAVFMDQFISWLESQKNTSGTFRVLFELEDASDLRAYQFRLLNQASTSDVAKVLRAGDVEAAIHHWKEGHEYIFHQWRRRSEMLPNQVGRWKAKYPDAKIVLVRDPEFFGSHLFLSNGLYPVEIIDLEAPANRQCIWPVAKAYGHSSPTGSVFDRANSAQAPIVFLRDMAAKTMGSILCTRLKQFFAGRHSVDHYVIVNAMAEMLTEEEIRGIISELRQEGAKIGSQNIFEYTGEKFLAYLANREQVTEVELMQKILEDHRIKPHEQLQYYSTLLSPAGVHPQLQRWQEARKRLADSREQFEAETRQALARDAMQRKQSTLKIQRRQLSDFAGRLQKAGAGLTAKPGKPLPEAARRLWQSLTRVLSSHRNALRARENRLDAIQTILDQRREEERQAELRRQEKAREQEL
ncbi:MAG: hypothetical protein HY586_06220, partial [Candidatus Omnitrophica bacterium]|nr:hypothetical protein [Candidatus Omnitrophota bacterium]